MRGIMIAALALVAGCNSVLGVSDVELLSPDAAMAQPMPDAGPSAYCSLDTHYTSLTADDSNAVAAWASGSYVHFLVYLNADHTDSLFIQLEDNRGGHNMFGNGGSYTLTASDASLSSCGICTLAAGDYDTTTGTEAQDYVARAGGQLSITTITAPTTTTTGKLSGRFQNLALRHVTLNTDTKTTTDDPDGCATTIADMPFSLTIPVPSFAPSDPPQVSLLGRWIGRE